MLAGILMLTVLIVVGVPGFRWRAHVLLLKTGGQIPDLEWNYVLAFLLPASEQSLARLIDTRNPYSVIRNPRRAIADIKAGAALFENSCASCHGLAGQGGLDGPALSSGKIMKSASDWGMFRTIRFGIPGNMPAHPLSETELWQLVTYIGSLETEATAAKRHDSSHVLNEEVPYSELLQTLEPANDWLTYSGSYSSTRHSLLTQVTPENVNELAVRWIYQFPGSPDVIETSPIVRRGTMFVTSPTGVTALSASDGKVLWLYRQDLPADALGGENGVMNRGVAILDDKVFVGTSDARLIALSIQTGMPVWKTAVADYKDGYYITGAPLAYRDLIVTGVSTKGQGRGFIVAYEASTGKERWRFFTIPAPGEKGHDSWKGDSWRNGGASTWMTGSYDPAADILYWGVGNPKPDYDPAVRKGDNLYSNSVVALNGSTGELVWHFQFSPGDDHDWDSAQIPIIANQYLLWANRNAFYYVLDRMSGRFIGATPFANQTWTGGFDSNGRPMRYSESVTARTGVHIYPSTIGATNWWSPTFDASLGRVFVPVLEHGMVFFPSNATSNSYPQDRSGAWYTAVRALDALTGNRVWEYRNEPRTVNPATGGLLSTKSGLVFGSDQTTFFALKSRTGELLWSFSTGGNIAAAPVTYAHGEKQFVVIASGNNLLAFGLPVPQQSAAR